MPTTSMSKGAERLAEAWWIDLPVVAMVTVAVASTTEVGRGIDLLGAVELTRRTAAMTSLITICSFFAGFTTLAFSVYLGMKSKGVQALRKVVGGRLLHLWLAQLATPWLATLAIWVAALADRGITAPTNDWRWVAMAAVLAVVVSLGRSVYIFAQLATLESSDPVIGRPTTERPLRVSQPLRQPVS